MINAFATVIVAMLVLLFAGVALAGVLFVLAVVGSIIIGACQVIATIFSRGSRPQG